MLFRSLTDNTWLQFLITQGIRAPVCLQTPTSPAITQRPAVMAWSAWTACATSSTQTAPSAQVTKCTTTSTNPPSKTALSNTPCPCAICHRALARAKTHSPFRPSRPHLPPPHIPPLTVRLSKLPSQHHIPPLTQWPQTPRPSANGKSIPPHHRVADRKSVV